jgi:hypothetical protein
MTLLKQTPHSPTVAALLGDVSAEQGKLDEAVQWYEMAVDSGAPSGIEEKLEAMKTRIRERDAASSEREIGLAQRTWASPPVLVGAAVIILMLLVCAYVAGTYRATVKPAPIQDQPPIVLPASTLSPSSSETGANPDAHPAEVSNSTPGNVVAAPTSPAASATKGPFDADLQPFFANASGPLARVTAAGSDPRNHSVTVDVPLQAGDEPRTLAAQVALATLAALKETTTVTVRMTSAGKAMLVADGTRDKYEAYTRAEHPSSDTAALADALLSNEWKDATDAPPVGR